MFTNPLSYNNFPRYRKETLEYHYDAFFAECRAYSSIIKQGQNGTFAPFCHGWTLVGHKVESQLWPIRGVVMGYIPGLDLDSVCLTKKIAEDVREGLLKMNNLSIVHNDVKAKNIMVCDERVVWIDFSASLTLPHIHGRKYEESLIGDKEMVESMFFILSHVRARYLTGPVRFSTLLTGTKVAD